MTLFEDGKGKYWYDKSDGKIAFYTKEGKSPINGKELKRITQTIARKYVYREE